MEAVETLAERLPLTHLRAMLQKTSNWLFSVLFISVYAALSLNHHKLVFLLRSFFYLCCFIAFSFLCFFLRVLRNCTCKKVALKKFKFAFLRKVYNFLYWQSDAFVFLPVYQHFDKLMIILINFCGAFCE